MAGDILSIGVSGLLAAQRAIATAGHNVANAATEGYSRQRVELGTQPPRFEGSGFVGSGVKVEDIVRLFDEFVARDIRKTTSSYNEMDRFYTLSAQMDGLLADVNASLNPAIQQFFDATQAVADAPTSVSARQSLLTFAESMVDRFNSFAQRVTDESDSVNIQIKNTIDEINSLAKAIANINRDIVNIQGPRTTQVANDLLDQRERLLKRLSENVNLSIVEQGDGAVNVFIGSGQTLVVGFKTQSLSATPNEFDGSKSDVSIAVGSTTVRVTEQINGGKLGGLLRYRDEILLETRNGLGRIAYALSSDYNEQHRLGIDLNGQLGQDVFATTGMSGSGIAAAPSSSNTTTSGINFLVTEPDNLTTSDYRLEYNGGDAFEITRLSDGNRTVFNTGGTYPYTSAQIDGFTVTITAPPTAGDRFLIEPTRRGAESLSLQIANGAQIAAAVPVRTVTGATNTGTGSIDDGVVTDETAFVNDTYNVIFGAATPAAADGGATVGTIVDNNNDSTLTYTLRVNGTVVYTQTEADAPLADLDALAAAINGTGNSNVGTTGVQAYVDNTAGRLYLANVPPSAVPISIVESLNTTAGTVEDGDTVTGYFGGALTGSSNPSASYSFNGQADSYIVVDSGGNTETSGTYTSGNNITFNGIQIAVSGINNLGDTYTVESNANGVGDNRNALALSGLQNALTMVGGTASYQEAYSQLVAFVGTKTNQAEIDRVAQEARLNQALSAQAEVSGVNLDEEASNILKFQQIYNATAQIVATADNLFNALLNAVGR